MLSTSQLNTFNKQGYLIVPNLLTAEDLAEVQGEYSSFLDEQAFRLRSEGAIGSLFEDESFTRRFALLNSVDPTIAKKIDIHLRLTRPLFNLVCHHRLLDIAEQIVGPEVCLSPVHHIRAKLPTVDDRVEASTTHTVPWHQDASVVWPVADDGFCLTVWVALSDSTISNGCVHVLPYDARRGFLDHHQTKKGTTIVDGQIELSSAIPVEIPAGGALLMNQLTPHCSIPNGSDQIRWSLDVRYYALGQHSGRPFHPSFLVRSRKHPKRVFASYEGWKEAWTKALLESKGIKFHRYHNKHQEQVASVGTKDMLLTGSNGLIGRFLSLFNG